MTTAAVFDQRKEDFKAVARAWDAAVKHIEKNPPEANQIMARDLGIDPRELTEMLRIVSFYDEETSKAHFGTAEEPGQMYQTMQYAIDAWSELGVLNLELTPADLIRHGIWDD